MEGRTQYQRWHCRGAKRCGREQKEEHRTRKGSEQLEAVPRRLPPIVPQADREAPLEFRFTKFGVATENGNSQLSKFLRGMANCGEDDLRFTVAGFAAGDAENANGGQRVLPEGRFVHGWNG